MAIANDPTHTIYYITDPFGRWVGVCATDAALFLVNYVITKHSHVTGNVLNSAQVDQLQRSVTTQLAVLRAIKTCLPSATDLQEACVTSQHLRIPFKNGFYDIAKKSFHGLPYEKAHYVLDRLNLTYNSILQANAADMKAAHQLLATWFPDELELQWLIRQLSRVLAPSLGDKGKTILIHVDTLDATQGSRGKTTFLRQVLQALFGSELCSVVCGDSLTVGQSSQYLKQRCNRLQPPAIEAFDELCTPTIANKRLDVSALKYLTSGSPDSSHLLYICCNPSNLPNLAMLAETDAATYSRIIMLPARPVFDKFIPGFRKSIKDLLPALCKLLIEEHAVYAHQGILAQPFSMQQHKQLMTRFTAAQTFQCQHMITIRSWLQHTIVKKPAAKLSRHALTNHFMSNNTQYAMMLHKYYSNKGMAQESLQEFLETMLDAALAQTNIHCEDGFYLDAFLQHH